MLRACHSASALSRVAMMMVAGSPDGALVKPCSVSVALHALAVALAFHRRGIGRQLEVDEHEILAAIRVYACRFALPLYGGLVTRASRGDRFRGAQARAQIRDDPNGMI